MYSLLFHISYFIFLLSSLFSDISEKARESERRAMEMEVDVSTETAHNVQTQLQALRVVEGTYGCTNQQ